MIRRLTTVLIKTSILLFFSCSSSLALSTQTEPERQPERILLKTQLLTQAKTKNPYRPIEDQFKVLGQAVEQDWKEWYWVYRVVERIARANNIDERPWRIGVMPTFDINAYATEINLVVAYSGILDQIYGDDAALACIMGHEMAHNQLRHIAKGEYINQQLLAQFQKEADDEINQLIAQEQKKYNSWQSKRTILGVLSGVLGLDLTFIAGDGTVNVQKIEEQKEQIIQEKTKAYLSSVGGSVREQEFEADKQGYIYMATAGYDPQGCLRVMDVLARTEGAEFDTTHPNVPARIDALQSLMREYPAASLATEGTQNLRAKPNPLTVDLTIKPHSLQVSETEVITIPTVRINSKFGSR